ncbi:MAG: hypothetical protein EOS10_33900 [Mesorhizobium sp.]|uniref:hypothetical protein n=1 Tax=Mesorhizobium sp. TaxID=1871066 RepID=UPI000FE6610E|nr:hypothetical protein [Mesorhizobium sp.]RWO23240.1 MAG: hypothetical protein EOS10_33900 [Mesorhizobium sp.]
MKSIVINHATVHERADMSTFLHLCAKRAVKSVSIWGKEIDKIGEVVALAALREHGITVFWLQSH